jgi:hypothetical protein
MNCEYVRRRTWSVVVYVKEGVRETKDNFSHGSQQPGRDLNHLPPEYKSRALPLHQPAR